MIKSPTLTLPKPLPSVIDVVPIVSTVPVEFVNGFLCKALFISSEA